MTVDDDETHLRLGVSPQDRGTATASRRDHDAKRFDVMTGGPMVTLGHLTPSAAEKDQVIPR